MRDYFLGNLSEQDVEQIERSYFAKEEILEELATVEERLIDDYLSGALPPEERARFETHYMASDVHARRVALQRVLGRRSKASVGRPARSRAWPLLAAAAVIVLAAGVWIYENRPGTSPGMGDLRNGEHHSIVSKLPDHTRLPRGRFVLEWEPGPRGTIYNVAVGTETLRPIARAVALTEPRYQLPEADLKDVPSGQVVIWRVEAQLPSGERVSSESYFAVVE